MLLRPTFSIDGDINDIDIDQLHAEGIRGLILDLDSTIMAPKSGEIDPDTINWLARARTRFKMMVLTNNKRDEYIKEAGTLLEMEVIGRAAKPFRAGFTQALACLELPPEEVAVIGDRPLTDILGGQMSSMRTVLVRPLRCIVEPRWKTCLRNMERLFIRP